MLDCACGVPADHCSTPRSPPASRALTPSLARSSSASRRPPAEGRPAHRLAAPPARRRAAASTPRPTSRTCSALHDRLLAELDGAGRLEWAVDECEAAPAPGPRRARPRGGLAADQGGPAAARHGGRRRAGRGRLARAASRRDRPAGALRAARPRPSSASPSARRRRSTSCAGSAGSTTASPGARSASEILDAVAEGRQRPPGGARRARPPELDRELRPAVDPGVGLDQPARPGPRDRHRRCWPPGPTSRRSCAERAPTPACAAGGGPSWSASPSAAWSTARPPSPSTAAAAWSSNAVDRAALSARP